MRLGALLALPLLIAATVVPRAGAAPPAMRQAVAIPRQVPLYLGVPEANYVAAWGPELSGKNSGYLRCPSATWDSVWTVGYDARGRSTSISMLPGCLPGWRLGWRTLARSFMPPDAQFVETIGSSGVPDLRSFHYSSAWLGARLRTDGGFVLWGSEGSPTNPGPWLQMEVEPLH